jgi:hypothetical protein
LTNLIRLIEMNVFELIVRSGVIYKSDCNERRLKITFTKEALERLKKFEVKQ